MFQHAVCRSAMALVVLSLLGGCAPSVGNVGGPDTTATLTWEAPTTNADGSPLTDLAGYKVYQGTSSGTYEVGAPIDVQNVLTYQAVDPPQGLHCFVVTAYDTSANESGYSNEGCKTIQ